MSTQYPSRVPDVTAFLLANLPAEMSLDPAQVVDGPPTEANLRSTCVIVGDTTMQQDWAALGARNRDENSVIRLVVYVHGPGQTQTQVNETAFGLLGLVELFLRTPTGITCGGLVNWISVVPVSIHKQQADQARIAYLSADLKFFARI